MIARQDAGASPAGQQATYGGPTVKPNMTDQSDGAKIKEKLDAATEFVKTMLLIAKKMRVGGNGDQIGQIVKHGDQALDRIGEAKELLSSYSKGLS
jgi:hypothetical protein